MSDPDSSSSNWGRWGPDDERGALNLVGPAERVRAAGLVREGRVFALGLPIRPGIGPTASHRPGVVHLMARDGGDYAAGAVAPDDVGTADDYLALPVHGTTHIDALCHLWYGGQLYNGHPSSAVRSSGAERNGIDKVEPLITRGVLLDVAGAQGVDHLTPDYGIGPEDLAACERRQGVEVGPGDVVLVRTGWVDTFAGDAAEFNRQQPGITIEAVPWLVARDVAAVGADNGAVERLPDPGGENAPVHRSLLRDYGVYLIELLALTELAAAAVWEFMFVAAPLRISRGTGSPLNPVAIV